MTDVPGYRLDRLIGRGASGEVWLARQRSAGERVVAVKCLTTSGGTQSRDKLRVEGRVLAALDHPHIVTLFDVVERPGGAALIMQYAGGGSLAALLGQRRLTAGQLVTIAAPLADALAYAHTRGTVHGDVTPANVLFTEDGRPLLADFGISRVAARLSARSGLAGTPHYLDPQVALGAPPEPSSDVYALGAICYEALTGRPPYLGKTPFELLQRARQGDRPALAELAPDTPAGLVDAIDRALQSAAEDRYGDAAEFADRLRAAAPAEPVRMLPREVPVPVGAPARPTREFGPRPPRTAALSGSRGSWDRLYDLAADRRLRIAGIVVLVAAAAGSVALLVSGAGDAGEDSTATSRSVPVGPATSSLPPSAAAAAVATPTLTPAQIATGTLPSSTTTARAPAPVATPSTAADWRTLLASLDERRSDAYASADVRLIDSVYAPGPDQRKDHDLVAGLAANKERVVGLRLNYVDVKVLTSSMTVATLDVIDELPAYQQLDASGALVKAYAGRPARRWVITLKRVSGEWRIAAISKAS